MHYPKKNKFDLKLMDIFFLKSIKFNEHIMKMKYKIFWKMIEKNIMLQSIKMNIK